MGDPVKRIVRRSRRPIFSAFLERARRKGAKTVAIIDGDGRKFTYQELVRAAFALGGPIARMTEKRERVGVLLPTGAGAVIGFLAILSRGRTPSMLNFTSGVHNLKAACRAAEVRHIVTAKKFIDAANLEKLVEDLSQTVQLVYLEDVKENLKRRDEASAILGPIFPSLFAGHPHPDEPGVILFTSGTEGDPKGVVLSHSNILANIEQISAHVQLEPTDVFFNPLPTFHCYGLTAGALWPILAGYPVVFHPSPLQTKIIPKRIFDTSSTVLFATDTFLQQYMRASEEGGMSSLRIAVCGAERVRDETRQAAEKRFSFEVLEGYGVTEAAPVLAANQPGDIRPGTVGRLLPGVEAKLEPVEGLEGAGRLFVRGPNIMQGYLTAEEPGVLKSPADGWHDTGDVVSIDKNGYISIRGRMKRFAKIGGEMVSLAVVENCASAVWPDNRHAATILPDPKKGEQIILVSDRENADRSLLLAWAQSHGVPEIAVPKKIINAEDIPVLGTGKTDYVAVEKLASEGLAALAAKAVEEAAAPPTKQELKKRAAEEKRAAKEAKKAAKAEAAAAKSEPAPTETGAEEPALESADDEEIAQEIDAGPVKAAASDDYKNAAE